MLSTAEVVNTSFLKPSGQTTPSPSYYWQTALASSVDNCNT